MVSITAIRNASPTVRETKKKWKMLVEANWNRERSITFMRRPELRPAGAPPGCAASARHHETPGGGGPRVERPPPPGAGGHTPARRRTRVPAIASPATNRSRLTPKTGSSQPTTTAPSTIANDAGCESARIVPRRTGGGGRRGPPGGGGRPPKRGAPKKTHSRPEGHPA